MIVRWLGRALLLASRFLHGEGRAALEGFARELAEIDGRPRSQPATSR